MFGLGPWEIFIILALVFLIFGVGKIPELGSGLGSGIRNFRKAIKGEDEPEKPRLEDKDTGDKQS